MEAILEKLRQKRGFICDMDGVIYHDYELLPGAAEFLDWLRRENKEFLFLTNSSERSRLELSKKLERMGLSVEPEHFYTSALATSDFIRRQSPGASVYCIGEAGLHNALYEAGLTMNDVNPDYVVVGETRSYNYSSIYTAVNLVQKGAKLIGTNPDISAPGKNGETVPACRSLIAPIELATGKSAYFLGKPNPLMMRTGMNILGCHSRDTVVVGDRMDTDIIAGIQSNTTTVLVLTGVTTRSMLADFPYGPSVVLETIGDLPEKEN